MTEFDRLMELSNQRHLPQEHLRYLWDLKQEGVRPQVVYDIGACVLHWTREAINVWPNAHYYAFEAMSEVAPLYEHFGISHNLGVLSDQDDKPVKFYQNLSSPFGNSYYKENEEESVPGIYDESHAQVKVAMTVDTIVKQAGWPIPDMVKIDVQGAEIDILRGATETLKMCRDLIIEVQHREYNLGAPQKDEVFAFLESLGFEYVSNILLKDCDGDYHFRKKVVPSIAYIIHTQSPNSLEWMKTAIDSCRKINLPFVLSSGYEDKTVEELSEALQIRFADMDPRAACATASHFAVWKRIAHGENECAVILEHDAVMIRPVDVNIPDYKIVALGYKFSSFDGEVSSEPMEVVDINRHSGAHAYCITSNTAAALFREIQSIGVPMAIDNFYFMRVAKPGDIESCIPLALTLPPAAVGLIRGSTIWDDPSTYNFTLQHAKVKYE